MNRWLISVVPTLGVGALLAVVPATASAQMRIVTLLPTPVPAPAPTVVAVQGPMRISYYQAPPVAPPLPFAAAQPFTGNRYAFFTPYTVGVPRYPTFGVPRYPVRSFSAGGIGLPRSVYYQPGPYFYTPGRAFTPGYYSYYYTPGYFRY